MNLLIKKLKIDAGQRVLILNSPADYIKKLGKLPENVAITNKLNGKFNIVQIFTKNVKELKKLTPKAIKALKPNGLIWISFPKGSSKIQTDLSRDSGWESIEKTNLKWIALISVNDMWSAFALRKPAQPTKK
jgi:hypothetical protein